MMMQSSRLFATSTTRATTLTGTATSNEAIRPFPAPYIPGRSVQVFRTKRPPLSKYERAIIAYKRKILKCCQLPPADAPVYAIGGIPKIKAIFNDMRILGVQKDARIYAAAIKSAIRLGEIDEAVQLLRIMVDDERMTASSTLYMRLIDACKFNQNPTMAQTLFDELLKVHPQIFQSANSTDLLANRAFTMLINVYSRVSDARAAEKFEEMKARGVKLTEISYGAVIKLFSRTRQFDKAFEYVQRMKDDGLSPNREIFNMLLRACNMPEDKHHATELFETMKLQGVARDSRTYTTIIDKMICCGDYDAAYKYYERMKEAKVRPRLHTYVLLLRGCVAQQDIVRARGVLREARRWGLKPDSNDEIMKSVEKIVSVRKEMRATRIMHVKAQRAARKVVARQAEQVKIDATQQNIAQILSHLAEERAQHKKEREAEES